MRWINHITTGLSLLMATGALLFLPAPASWIVAMVFAAIAACAATAKGNVAKNKFIVRLKGFAWTREDFCRGWLITGDTGSPAQGRSKPIETGCSHRKTCHRLGLKNPFARIRRTFICKSV
jgi:hypothetical protein